MRKSAFLLFVALLPLLFFQAYVPVSTPSSSSEFEKRTLWREMISEKILTQFSLKSSPSKGLFSLDSGLVAHYTFNQCDARDNLEGGSDGVAFGNPGCQCGVENNALWLDGLDDYVEFPGRVNRFFTTMDFTVSFYFRQVGYSVFRQSMLSKRVACDELYLIDFQLDVNKKEVNTAFFESPEKYYRDISPPTDTTDWMHFALVREGTHVYTYINGQLRRQASKCSGVDISNEAVLSFSNSPCLTSGRAVRFKGGLDELRVYDRALSEEEIWELYALNPVELAEIDCVTFRLPSGLEESRYVCQP